MNYCTTGEKAVMWAMVIVPILIVIGLIYLNEYLNDHANDTLREKCIASQGTITESARHVMCTYPTK